MTATEAATVDGGAADVLPTAGDAFGALAAAGESARFAVDAARVVATRVATEGDIVNSATLLSPPPHAAE